MTCEHIAGNTLVAVFSLSEFINIGINPNTDMMARLATASARATSTSENAG
ncbi:hypothetical protein [Phragmitibacter flavus]|uniref:hypothetical protein n=1 Tax=Phragmitibacter flavus TaxID=2576071 RepID=UPI00140A46C5|nr:hypothetical protein [Phragmitibacter flavus]